MKHVNIKTRRNKETWVDMKQVRQQIGQLHAQVQTGGYLSDSLNCHILQDIITFCDYTGSRISVVLQELVKVTDSQIQLDSDIKRALAAPTSAIKIMRVLPLVSLGVGVLFGANVLKALFSPFGATSLLLGVLLWIIGMKQIGSKVDSFESLRISNYFKCPQVQLVLVKASILAGNDIVTSLRALNVDGVEDLMRGVPYAVANLPSHFICLDNAYNLGMSPIGVIDSKLDTLRSDNMTQIKVQGEELGVQLLVPIAAFFLPSFLLIGVIPTILAMASGW